MLLTALNPATSMCRCMFGRIPIYSEGDDLWHVAVISYPQAALGAEITVPTLEGPTLIKIRPGTQVGDVVTLRVKGMPRFAVTVAVTCWCA
jgi:DnaJ-class molecular chaperone